MIIDLNNLNQNNKNKSPKNYIGQLLAANPSNPQNNQLNKGVILITGQIYSTIIGLQINNVIPSLSINDVIENLGFWIDGEYPVYYGGNLGTNKLHIVHSSDWSGMTTRAVTNSISVTSDISILAALSENEGPKLWRACAGHWSWNQYLLEQQLSIDPDQEYKWEICPATIKFVFYHQEQQQWEKVMTNAAQQAVSDWINN